MYTKYSLSRIYNLLSISRDTTWCVPFYQGDFAISGRTVVRHYGKTRYLMPSGEAPYS